MRPAPLCTPPYEVRQLSARETQFHLRAEQDGRHAIVTCVEPGAIVAGGVIVTILPNPELSLQDDSQPTTERFPAPGQPGYLVSALTAFLDARLRPPAAPSRQIGGGAVTPGGGTPVVLRLVAAALPALLAVAFAGLVALLALALDDARRKYALDFTDRCIDFSAVLVTGARHRRTHPAAVARAD